MPISSSELRELVIRRVNNYPDLNRLIAQGAIVKKGAWYEIRNKGGFDALIDYATSVRVEGEKTLLKVAKPNKSLQKLASKLAAR